jgi:excisionase family DNA binding protein
MRRMRQALPALLPQCAAAHSCHVRSLHAHARALPGNRVARMGGPVIGGSNKYIPAKEAAEFLGVHPDTLYRKWQEWGIPGVRIGTRLKFRVRDLEEWLRKQEA